MKTEQIRLTPTLRVESGPARKTAIAHAGMAPDVDEQGMADPNKQEKHAKLPDGTLLARHYKLGLRDAAGRPIVEGKEFTYLDHFGPPAWYYYRLEDVRLEDALLATMAEKLHTAADALTREQISQWFGLNSPDWVSKDGKGAWQMKRFVAKGVCATRDDALSALAALKE